MRTLNFQHVGRQMSESFLTAAVLSISGGLQDVYTYVSRGEVFANAQTGNIVLFSQNVFACNWELTIRYLVPVLFFCIWSDSCDVDSSVFSKCPETSLETDYFTD